MKFSDDTPDPNELPEVYPRNPPRNVLRDRRLLSPLNLYAFEGLEGAGKSTLIKCVETKLKEMGRDCIVYGLRGSDIITHAIERAKWKNSDPYIYNLINWVALFDHTSEIVPLLNTESPLIFDRYTVTVRVRGKLEGMDESLMDLLEPMVPAPKIIFYIDSNPETCVRRVVTANRAISYWEAGSRDAEYEGALLKETNPDLRRNDLDRSEPLLKHLIKMRNTYEEVLSRYDNVVTVSNQGDLDSTSQKVAEHIFSSQKEQILAASD